MAIGDSKPAKDIPALVPGVDFAAADKPQPPIDDVTKKLYQDAQSATFQVIGLAQDRSFPSKGSGYIADSHNEGLTNAHVVLGNDELLVVTTDGSRHQAKIVDMDDIKDVAKIEVLGLTPSENHWLPLSTQPLQKNDKVWALGHPLGREELYISPGKFLKQNNSLSATLDYVQTLGKSATPEEVMAANTTKRPASEVEDVLTRLQIPFDESDAHVERGNSGGPFINQKEEVTGLFNKLVHSDGGSGMVPLETLRSFLDQKDHKFTFNYQSKSDAALWMNGWSSHPLHNVEAAATDLTLAGIGMSTIFSGRFKIGASSLGLLAANELTKDYYDYRHSASSLMGAEAGIKIVADSVALLGSSAMMVPKFRFAGELAFAAGAIAHTAANFLPSHLILTKTTRVEGPDRPPTPFE